MEILLNLATTNVTTCLLIFHSKADLLTVLYLPAAECAGSCFFLGLKKKGRKKEKQQGFLEVVCPPHHIYYIHLNSNR